MKMKFAVGLVALIVLSGVGAFFLLRDGGPEGGDGGKFEGTLRIGMECDFAPYNWQEDKESGTNVPLSNKAGAYAEGYDVQIAKAIAGRMGAKMEIVLLPWDDLLPALQEGKIDMIVSGMVDTEARKQVADFSAVYAPSPIEYTIMVRKDSRYAEGVTLADFHSARMVGQKGAMMDSLIDQIQGVQHLPPVETIPDMFREVDRGAADGLVINMEGVGPYMKEYPSLVSIHFLTGEGFQLGFNGICAAVRKGDKTLLNAVNNAISSIPTEERKTMMDEIEKKRGA